MDHAALALMEVHEETARYGDDDDALDALEELGDEIATLAAHLHAATHRLLTLIARFDHLRGWENDGFRSCAHWLAFRTGINLGAAREKVRAALALESLPLVSASMARGELSFTKVRALTRVATPTNETELLELARAGTAAGLEKVVRAWRRLNRLDEAELERVRHRSRCFSVFPDEDGMYVVRGRLDPEVGAALMRAIEAAGDALYRAGTSGRDGQTSPTFVEREREAKQRRADAMGLLAERALAVGFGGACGDDDDACGDHGDGAGNSDDGTDSTIPISGSRAERYQVLLHVEAPTLQIDQEPGRSELEDGTRVSAETSRRMACDAAVVRITTTAAGSTRAGSMTTASVLDVGRKTRTIPPALRRALEIRDGGCRFPGCGLRFTDAHHIRHWADGGETKLSNTLLLCRFHHRAVHEEGYRVDFPEGGRPNFYDPKGRPLPDAPPPPRFSHAPTRALVHKNLLTGVRPEFWTCKNGHKTDDEVPVEVFVRVLRAMDGQDARADE